MSANPKSHTPQPKHGSPVARKQSRLAAMGALALSLLPASQVRAASIIWDTPTLISADTDVSTEGSLLYAHTFGDTGVPSATVNGVTFAPFAAPNNTSATVTVGNVSLAVSAGDLFFTDNTRAGWNLGSFADLTAAYRGLLQSGASTTPTNSSLTLTLGGLTSGQIYQVQFWSNDSGELTDGLTGTLYTAGNSVVLDHKNSIINGGVGEWVTGTFTADASTQVITLESTSPVNDFPAINALQVRVVPEPSAALLLLSGVTLFLCRRSVRKA